MERDRFISHGLWEHGRYGRCPGIAGDGGIHYKLPYPFVRPRLLVAIEFRLARVLNFSRVEVPVQLGINEQLLAGEDWRKMQVNGDESYSQAIGRAACLCNAEAIVTNSARARNGMNIAYFPERRRNGSVAAVCEPRELERLEKSA